MTCGVLLAAGLGTRFTGPSHKLLAEIDGRPVVLRALDSMMSAGFEHNIVVTGAADLGELPGFDGRVELVSNPRYAQGQATSLDVAITVAARRGHDRVVVGLGDQPFVDPAAWRSVAASSSPIAVATYGGRQRNPVGLHRSVWPLLPINGDDAARVVLRVRPELIQPVACEGFPDDIDTVEDLRRWS